MIVTAARRAGQQLVRMTTVGGGVVFGAHVLTVAQVAGELMLSDLDAPTPLSALGSEAVAARAIARCREARPFAFFERVARTPGFPRAVIRTLTELRRHSVESTDLEFLGPRGADLSRLLLAYDEELRRSHLADGPALLEGATALIAGGDQQATRFCGLRLLLLDVPLRSPLEVGLVAALVSNSPDVLAVAPAADEVALANLERLLAVRRSALTEPSPSASGLARARSFVFHPDPPAPARALDDSFVLFSSPGEGAECVEIARRLLALARAGLPFDRCAVLLRDPDRYQPLLEHALDRAGIAGLFSRGVVRPHPAGRAFLALLDCALDRLSANRFAEYLSLGQVPSADDQGGPPRRPVPWVEPDEEQRLGNPQAGGGQQPMEPVAAEAEADSSPVIAGSLRTPVHWERLLVEASVIGGLDRWRRRLSGLEQELRVRLAACQSHDLPRAEHLQRQLERLDNLERFAVPLIETLAALPDSATWSTWLDRLEKLATKALREPAHILRVLAELRPMAEVGPVSVSEVRQTLTDRLTNLRASAESDPFGGVFVGTLEEARGRSFHTVFLPGLADGMFPRKMFEDPLLLDADRQRIGEDASRPALPRQAERVAEERFLLALALGAAEANLVASFPTLDSREGRARVPSFYALDLIRAAEAKLPAQGVLMRQAAAGSFLRQGWPAPRDAGVAIDAAEYDLAILAPLLQAPEAEARGRARFLLRLDPVLERSLRSRWLRWSRRFTPADGLVDPGIAAREALAAYGIAEQVFSATALQQLAACPYRFFLHAIHGLRPRDEAGLLEELDPLTKGEIFHSVQTEFLRELRGRDRLPLRAENETEVFDLLDGTVDRQASAYRERLVPALPRVWESEIEELRLDLRGWVRELIESAEDWVPAHFELAFGLPVDERYDIASRLEPVGILNKLRLRGSIDLVEKAANGGLRATDHKTGRPPDTKVLTIGRGESLQPLLYALAASETLGRAAHSGRLHYCTRRGGYSSFEVRLDDRSLFALSEMVGLVEDLLARGFLPAAPREGACTHCDYRSVCGPWEEVRIRRKPAAALSHLAAIRRRE